jgi:hypothetical protein
VEQFKRFDDDALQWALIITLQDIWNYERGEKPYQPEFTYKDALIQRDSLEAEIERRRAEKDHARTR